MVLLNEQPTDRQGGENLRIGLVLSFAYMHGSSQRSKEFSRSFATIKHPNAGNNPIGFLCTFYRYDPEGNLHELGRKGSYISLSSYRATITLITVINRGIGSTTKLLQ